jgi:hypothetical protein
MMRYTITQVRITKWVQIFKRVHEAPKKNKNDFNFTNYVIIWSLLFVIRDKSFSYVNTISARFRWNVAA